MIYNSKNIIPQDTYTKMCHVCCSYLISCFGFSATIHGHTIVNINYMINYT